MTPISRGSSSPSVMVLALAACSSSFILLRTIVIFLLSPSLLSAGVILRRTVESLGPRMSSTTSSKRQPTTSMRGPCVPWPTAVILSAGFNSPPFAAGPAGTKRTTSTLSSSLFSTAPMPSNERDMFMLKFSEVRGEKYSVCGSYVWAKALM